jgi:hypothetical protein
VAPSHDKRFPEDVTMCTSYTPGVPRLGVPALLMSDSSMGIVNLDFRPGDTATALPAPVRGPPGRQQRSKHMSHNERTPGPCTIPGADEHTR